MMKVGCQISQITKTDGWGRTESFGDILPCFFNLYDFKRDSSQDAKILMIPTSLNRCRLRVHLPTPWNLKYLACLSCSNAKESKKPRYFSAYVLPPPLVVCLPLVSWTDETSGAERLSQNQRSTNEWYLSSQKKKYKKWWFWCMSPSEALLSIVLLQINSRLVWTSVQPSSAPYWFKVIFSFAGPIGSASSLGIAAGLTVSSFDMNKLVFSLWGFRMPPRLVRILNSLFCKVFYMCKNKDLKSLRWQNKMIGGI